MTDVPPEFGLDWVIQFLMRSRIGRHSDIRDTPRSGICPVSDTESSTLVS
jgi:hypothetical protein